MSRHSPTGFAFSMLIEIAAVVIIVSLLPRVDLRPRVSAAPPGNTAASPPTEPGTPSLLTSFQRPPADSRPSLAPSLVETPPLNPQDVERRLDRASQQLVNSFGSTVSSVASDFAEAIRPTLTPQSTWPGLSQPSPVPAERQVTLLPLLPSYGASSGLLPPYAQPNYAQSNAPQQNRPPGETSTPAAPAGSFPTQPRPWIRY